MQFSEDRNTTKFQVTSYQPGTIRINADDFTDAVIVSPESLAENAFVDEVEKITVEHIQKLCQAKPEIILIGTGETQKFLHRNLLKEAAKFNLSLEVMNTQAACRTFAVLATEGRRVIAALIP